MNKNQFMAIYTSEKERLSVYPNIKISYSWNEEKGYKSLYYSFVNNDSIEIQKLAVCLNDYGNLSHFLIKTKDCDDKFKSYLNYELELFSKKPQLLTNRLVDFCVPHSWKENSITASIYNNTAHGNIDVIGYWVNNYIDEHSWNMENGSRKYSNWLYVENSGHGNANTPALKVERFQLDFNSEDNVQQKEFYNPYKLYNAEYIEKCKQNEEQQNTIDEDYQER